MRASIAMLGAAGIMAALSMPAAADSMMMQKGETLLVMPDGTMSTMMNVDKDTSSTMMEKAKPMDHAMIMMMGSDGKMYVMEDTTMPDGKMLSDDMMMMGK